MNIHKNLGKIFSLCFFLITLAYLWFPSFRGIYPSLRSFPLGPKANLGIGKGSPKRQLLSKPCFVLQKVADQLGEILGLRVFGHERRWAGYLFEKKAVSIVSLKESRDVSESSKLSWEMGSGLRQWARRWFEAVSWEVVWGSGLEGYLRQWTERWSEAVS